MERQAGDPDDLLTYLVRQAAGDERQLRLLRERAAHAPAARLAFLLCAFYADAERVAHAPRG